MFIYNHNYLKQLRQSERLSRKALADLLGITERHLLRIENGESKISFPMLNKYATLFDSFDINQLYVVKEGEQN